METISIDRQNCDMVWISDWKGAPERRPCSKIFGGHPVLQLSGVTTYLKLVYLLTPMNRATLSHAKSPIPHCTPSEIKEQQALRAIFKAHCYT